MPHARTALLALAALTLVACGPPLPTALPGNITFSWTFVSETCAQHPEIQSVHVIIPGETLENDGYYPCSVNNFAGVVLHDFAPGNYSFQLEAVGYQSQVLFVGSGSLVVDGDVGVAYDLVPAGELPSYAFLSWTFPAPSGGSAPTCAQAGISFVDMVLDGQNGHFNCTDGTASPGVRTPFLSEGHHTLQLTATDSTGLALYGTQSTLDTTAGAPVSASFSLQWVVGGAVVQFQPYNGSTAQTCAEAGDPKVWVNFVGSNGPLFNGNGDGGPSNLGYNCGDVVTFSELPPDQYQVQVYATGPGGTYTSQAPYEPHVTVNAGVFPTNTDAVTVPVYKN
jgi:hypothetical protein